MDLLSYISLLTKDLPTALSIFISIATLGLVWWLHFRKVDIEEKTSSSNIHERQVETLMKQITLLSEELEKTRDQLSGLHESSLELMLQLREANKRITELEHSLANRS